MSDSFAPDVKKILGSVASTSSATTPTPPVLAAPGLSQAVPIGRRRDCGGGISVAGFFFASLVSPLELVRSRCGGYAGRSAVALSFGRGWWRQRWTFYGGCSSCGLWSSTARRGDDLDVPMGCSFRAIVVGGTGFVVAHEKIRGRWCYGCFFALAGEDAADVP
ncbi:hypothetical protein PVAP13_4KG128500 [Panicum virgatum]|uniref:Uncharacterized protein n=1 Tax=Panicum virgatum TaxID=38727 RepID=A0A8T0THH3_PANVG|nr:hypothetical protein PVAP13_4KG128500 [Panicum virgatum]